MVTTISSSLSRPAAMVNVFADLVAQESFELVSFVDVSRELLPGATQEAAQRC